MLNQVKNSSIFVDAEDHGYEASNGGGMDGEKLGTEWDQRGMARMGKKQELRREFRFFSITGYAMILGCSWEFALINVVLTLSNGGKAGTIWMLLVAIIGMSFVCLSMAEMASIAPTAGGQYHWTSEFAPQRYQKILSYGVGFFGILGWQTSLAATCYAAAQQIIALVVLQNENFTPKAWETSVISWAVLLLCIFCNTVLFRRLPLIEGIVTFLHVMAFFAFIIVLWVMAPRGSPTEVFTKFENNGWQSTGVACLIGLNAPVAYLTGADSSVHLAEELHNAAWTLPRSMLLTALSNYITSFVIVVTLMFCLGDLESVVQSPTGQPYLAVLLNATGSKTATTVLGVVVLLLVISCSINGVTTSSRQLWAFARDGGLPGSDWLARIRPGYDVPVNAIAVSMIFTVVLTSIAIGSSVAYNIFVSLNVSGLVSSYIICIGCILYRRLRGEQLPLARFSLGKAGPAINIVALSFLLVAWVFQFLPAMPNPSPLDMNWSCVIWSALVIFFSVYYLFRGKRSYEGPVVNVRKDL